MAAADLVFPPMAPPPGHDNGTIDMSSVGKLAFVQVLVILAVAAMFLRLVLGSLRRQSSNGFLHHIVMGVNTLSYPLVGYTIGLMKSSDLYYNDFVVWGVFLLLLLYGADNPMVCRLSDIDNWKSIYVKHLIKGFFLVYILVVFGHHIHKTLWYPLSAILFVMVLKSYVMIASMRMVSKTYLGKNMKVIAQYMQHIKDNNPLVPFDPVTMEGYQYMVSGERHCIKRRGRAPCYDKVTTVEQIWKCTGNLLRIERKDLCLSMALSKMLNRRFAGIKLSEAELRKGHEFVFRGLLAVDEPHQRAFKVIEEELVFVHDMYYTRYAYVYQKGRFLALCLPAIMFALCLWLTLACLRVKKHDSHHSSKHYSGMQDSTIFITAFLAFLEAYQLYLYIASGWFKVALIRSYVSTPFLQRSCCFEKIIDLLLRLKAFRPWKHTLGQYCLLDGLGRKSRFKSCLHYTTLRLVDKSIKGRKKSVKLSENVKKAVIDSLLESNGHLTNGVTSLQNNGVHAHLSWACDGTGTDGAVTRTILVWHIATTLCEHHHQDKQAKEEDTVKIASTSSKFCMHLLAFMPYQRGKEAEDRTTEAVKTASTLSKYCTHLVAFLPDLLPDHSSISESILDESVEEAGKLLQGAKDLKSRCEMLMKINTHDCLGDETRLVAQGVHLYRHLIEDIQESALRWKVLSDFWAEMMLYISPSDDARAHLELLARGGEFITHLWALLTHVGVLKRGQPWPNNVV